MTRRRAATLVALGLSVLLQGCLDNPARPSARAQPEAPAGSERLPLPEAAPATPPVAAHVRVEAAEKGPTPAANDDAAANRRPIVHKPLFSAKSALYDESGPAFVLLQSAAEALHGFPADAHGNVDWVQALDKGLIAPRASLSGSGSMRRRTDDIVMRQTREMPWVLFPHEQHSAWLDCINCHPDPFREKAGANQITMDSIMRGQHCGMCHDRVAFSIFACERCHSITHPGSPAAWW